MKIKYFLIIAVLAIAILCFGPTIKAQTTDNSALIVQLQAQIASLIAQIQALQAQQGTSTIWCHTFNTSLKFGDSGSEVQALDVALGKEGFSVNEQKDNPPFAEPTASAVVGFQEKYASEILTPNGLKHGTGFVGISTRAKLNSLYSCGTTTTPPTTCTPSWTCGWGACVNGYQSQAATDSNNCGLSSSSVNIACPALARACAYSTQPSITVLSPNGGETWQTGTTQTIRWNTNGIPSTNNMTVRLRSVATNQEFVTTNVLNTGSASISIPADFTVGQYTAEVKTALNGISYIDASNTPFTITNSSSQLVNGINIMKEDTLNNFYSNLDDSYDFLVIFSLKPMNADFSQVVNESGETLGYSPTPISSSSSKNLKSFLYLDISGVDSSALSGVSVSDFEQGNMRIYLNTLAHEISHHWLAYIPWEGMSGAHYTNMVDLFGGSLSYSDPMEYDHWVKTASGNVCVDHNSNTVIPRFSNLSMYLMGLIPKSSVQPIPVIQTSVDYPYGHPYCDETTNFLDTKTYTIDDILTLAGKDRVPVYPNTQKDFKVGYILLVPANENASVGSIQFASDIISQFPQYWYNATNSLSHIVAQ